MLLCVKKSEKEVLAVNSGGFMGLKKLILGSLRFFRISGNVIFPILKIGHGKKLVVKDQSPPSPLVEPYLFQALRVPESPERHQESWGWPGPLIT